MSRGMLLFDGKGNPQLRLGDGKTVELKQDRPERNGRIMLLIDCSESMGRGDKLSQAKDGAVSFANEAFEGGNSVGLASFDYRAWLHSEPCRNLEVVRATVHHMVANGTTNMADGISLATRCLGESGARTIVLVTDGEPDCRIAALEEARKAKSRGIDIICIGVDGADLGFLKQIASIEKMAQKVDSGNHGLQNAMKASVGLLQLKGRK